MATFKETLFTRIIEGALSDLQILRRDWQKLSEGGKIMEIESIIHALKQKDQ